MNKFVFGSFVYEYYLKREDRKTLSLTVMPDLSITVKCPSGADEKRIELFLSKKWFWLQKQINFFKKFRKKIYPKEYISGESFLYLGRQYKLVVKKSDKDGVSFSRGLITLSTTKSVSNGKYNKSLLDKWYQEKAERVFSVRFNGVKKLFDYEIMPELSIREMKKRWGSFLNHSKIFLNPRLIQVSKDCIDYVIIHELCHMKHKNHNKQFYALLKIKCPNWEKIKDKLESRF
jgi:predicted metal-dependent hydrolase